jgi:hypothetical protein
MRKFLIAKGKIAAVALLSLFMAIPLSAQISLRTAMDFDKDQKADFPIFRKSAGNLWAVKNSSGSYIFQWFGIANEDWLTPGDYDGDGKADISVWRDTDGYWYRLNSSDNTFTGVKWGIPGDEPVARDYDNDGRTDFAVARRVNGIMQWWVLKNKVTGFDYISLQFGLATDFVAPGDYDGDGMFDFAIQRPGATPDSQTIFWILKSKDFTDMVYFFGLTKDLVVPGDYDGDHVTDIAVVREGENPDDPLVWWVLRSSDGQGTAYWWGRTRDCLTVQNDYDGDGITDVAIWNDTEGNFYVLRSSGGGYDVIPWGASGDLPVANYDTH